MSSTAPVSYSADAGGVGWIVFDDHDARVNVLNQETQDALAHAIDQAERDTALSALVVMSGKERIFIAGADLNAIAALPDAAAATEFSRRGQRLLQRLVDFRVPVVSAIHGACAGGGFELALACHWRIASDAGFTRIGFPETSIGTIPGWGGSVRLPRLVGVKPALDHILNASLVSAAEARDAGFVHGIVPASELQARARAAVLKLVAEGPAVPVIPPAPVPDLYGELRRSVEAKTRGQLPALIAAIDVIERSSQLPIPEALEVEAGVFGQVTAGVVCKNLIRVFFLRDAARKRTLEGWFPTAGAASRRDLEEGHPDHRDEKSALPPIRRVGVVGAGVMGSGIAQWLAACGFEVVLRDVQPEILDRGLMVARRLFDEAVKRGKLTAGEANSGLHRIATTARWDGFATCELVIEAIVENTAAKQTLFTELASVVVPTAILASNSSALPIEEIAGHVPHPERTLGIHFFNPVSRMALVELIIGRETSAENAGRALALVQALGKSPIVCRSSPGFLVTRVLFFYLNEAVRLWEQGACTAEIDEAMREFGWPMGPLRLIDEVGVDVTDFIFAEMAHYFPSRFMHSTACARLLSQGLLGRKNGTSRGFYRYEDGIESKNDGETVPLCASATKIPGESGAPAGERSEIVDRLMRVLAGEAQRCLDEGVVRSADDVDFALLSGAGFPAFRGGLLHWARGKQSKV